VQLLPGTARLVAHLAAHRVPLAIATGSSRRNFERKTAHLQHVFKHFGDDHVVCGGGDDGGLRGKPFPDVFLAAARLLGRGVGSGSGDVNREEGDGVWEAELEERARGLVFEDAIPGVMAGKRAGMNGAFSHPSSSILCAIVVLTPRSLCFGGVVVWVPDENLLSVGSSQLTDSEKPDQVLRSLEDFVPEEWGLPPYDDVPGNQQSGKEE
jgi:pseudouridine 5'-phosphatase